MDAPQGTARHPRTFKIDDPARRAIADRLADFAAERIEVELDVADDRRDVRRDR